MKEKNEASTACGECLADHVTALFVGNMQLRRLKGRGVVVGVAPPRVDMHSPDRPSTSTVELGMSDAQILAVYHWEMKLS